jgi:alkyl hydroperoxide reductase subunit AhpC
LLSDQEKRVSRQYGVLSFFPRLARRTTFVLDQEGVIRHIDRGKAALSPNGVLKMCSLQASEGTKREAENIL